MPLEKTRIHLFFLQLWLTKFFVRKLVLEENFEFEPAVVDKRIEFL